MALPDFSSLVRALSGLTAGALEGRQIGRERRADEEERRRQAERQALADSLTRLQISGRRRTATTEAATATDRTQTIATLRSRFPEETVGLGDTSVFKMRDDLLDPNRGATKVDADFYRAKYTNLQGLSDAETINRGRARDQSALVEERRPQPTKVDADFYRAKYPELVGLSNAEVISRGRARDQSVLITERRPERQPIEDKVLKDLIAQANRLHTARLKQASQDPTTRIAQLRGEFEPPDWQESFNEAVQNFVTAGRITPERGQELGGSVGQGAVPVVDIPEPPGQPGQPELSPEELQAAQQMVAGAIDPEGALREAGYSPEEIRKILGG